MINFCYVYFATTQKIGKKTYPQYSNTHTALGHQALILGRDKTCHLRGRKLMLPSYYISGTFWTGKDNSDSQLTPKMKHRPDGAHNRVGQMDTSQIIRGKGNIATLGRATGVHNGGVTKGGILGKASTEVRKR